MTNVSVTRAHFLDNAAVVERSIAMLAEKSDEAGRAIVSALRAGKKVVTFGNGGSATQASHLAQELIGRFVKNRRALPGIALVADSGAMTCIANDFGYETVFERQVSALVEKGDVVVGLTTSGASPNVIRGLKGARDKGAVTIALTGETGLQGISVDHLISVPSTTTAHIQEVHLMLIHSWCISVDDEIS